MKTKLISAALALLLTLALGGCASVNHQSPPAPEAAKPAEQTFDFKVIEGCLALRSGMCLGGFNFCALFQGHDELYYLLLYSPLEIQNKKVVGPVAVFSANASFLNGFKASDLPTPLYVRPPDF